MKPLVRLYQALPAPIQRWSRPAKTAFSAAAKARSGVWILSGHERSGGAPFSVAYTGGEAAKSYLAKRLFAAPVVETPLPRQWRWRAAETASRASSNLSLHFTEVPWSHEGRFRPGAFAYLPGWISTELDMAGGEWKATKRFKRARAAAEKSALTRSFTRDPAEFADFYRFLYQPYLAARHDRAAVVLPLEPARREFVEKGQELLLLKDGDRTAAGLVFEPGPGRARSWQLGIRLGGEEDSGRLSDALFYHLLTRLEEAGVPRLHMGSCRPFLSDGLLDYKRSWGAKLVDEKSENAGLWALTVLRETPALMSFLKHNPFAAVDREGRFRLFAFVDRMGTPEAAAAAADLDEFRAPGRLEPRLHELTPGIVPFRSPT